MSRCYERKRACMGRTREFLPPVTAANIVFARSESSSDAATSLARRPFLCIGSPALAGTALATTTSAAAGNGTAPCLHGNSVNNSKRTSSPWCWFGFRAAFGLRAIRSCCSMRYRVSSPRFRPSEYTTTPRSVARYWKGPLP